MTTIATAEIKDLASKWENECGLASATLSGIVGDSAHRARGGYHISRHDNPSGNYSIVRPDDKTGGPSNAAAAIDMSMTKADMITCTRRLLSIYDNRSDPRRRYCNAFNGWLGSGDASRWDLYAGTRKYATADHKWHVHLEIHRRYVEDSNALKAVLSGLKGESVGQYMGVVTPPVYPGYIMKRNDQATKPDLNVRKWQARMLDRGWASIGLADGYFGQRTEDVVKRFQQHCKVHVDGEIGPATWPLPWTDPLG